MNYFVKIYKKDTKTNEVYNPCGNNGSWIINDLKTLKGVKNRILKNNMLMNKNNNYVKFEVYSYTNLYNDSTFNLLDTIYN